MLDGTIPLSSKVLDNSIHEYILTSKLFRSLLGLQQTLRLFPRYLALLYVSRNG